MYRFSCHRVFLQHRNRRRAQDSGTKSLVKNAAVNKLRVAYRRRCVLSIIMIYIRFITPLQLKRLMYLFFSRPPESELTFGYATRFQSNIHHSLQVQRATSVFQPSTLPTSGPSSFISHQSPSNLHFAFFSRVIFEPGMIVTRTPVKDAKVRVEHSISGYRYIAYESNA